MEAIGEAGYLSYLGSRGPFEDVDVVHRELDEAASSGFRNSPAPVRPSFECFLRPHHSALMHEPGVAVDHIPQPAGGDHVSQVVDQRLVEVTHIEADGLRRSVRCSLDLSLIHISEPTRL